MSHDNLTAGKPAKPRVAVLFGGRSSEHAVSCVTAAGVLGAINKDKYEVIPIKTGQWVLASADTAQWSLAGSALPEVKPSAETVTLAEIGGDHQLIAAAPNEVPRELGTVDVVFPLLHGPFGEDGTIQTLLGHRHPRTSAVSTFVSLERLAATRSPLDLLQGPAEATATP